MPGLVPGIRALFAARQKKRVAGTSAAKTLLRALYPATMQQAGASSAPGYESYFFVDYFFVDTEPSAGGKDLT